VKAASYLVILSCACAPCLVAADSITPPPAPQSISPTPGSTATIASVRSFLETTHYFEIFAMGFKEPWQKRLLENKTGEKRATLDSLIDAMTKDHRRPRV
jgi:hypothetical protein